MPKKSRNGYQMKFETNDDDVHFFTEFSSAGQ